MTFRDDIRVLVDFDGDGRVEPSPTFSRPNLIKDADSAAAITHRAPGVLDFRGRNWFNNAHRPDSFHYYYGNPANPPPPPSVVSYSSTEVASPYVIRVRLPFLASDSGLVVNFSQDTTLGTPEYDEQVPPLPNAEAIDIKPLPVLLLADYTVRLKFRLIAVEGGDIPTSGSVAIVDFAGTNIATPSQSYAAVGFEIGKWYEYEQVATISGVVGSPRFTIQWNKGTATAFVFEVAEMGIYYDPPAEFFWDNFPRYLSGPVYPADDIPYGRSKITMIHSAADKPTEDPSLETTQVAYDAILKEQAVDNIELGKLYRFVVWVQYTQGEENASRTVVPQLLVAQQDYQVYPAGPVGSFIEIPVPTNNVWTPVWMDLVSPIPLDTATLGMRLIFDTFGTEDTVIEIAGWMLVDFAEEYEDVVPPDKWIWDNSADSDGWQVLETATPFSDYVYQKQTIPEVEFGLHNEYYNIPVVEGNWYLYQHWEKGPTTNSNLRLHITDEGGTDSFAPYKINSLKDGVWVRKQMLIRAHKSGFLTASVDDGTVIAAPRVKNLSDYATLVPLDFTSLTHATTGDITDVVKANDGPGGLGRLTITRGADQVYSSVTLGTNDLIEVEPETVYLVALQAPRDLLWAIKHINQNGSQEEGGIDPLLQEETTFTSEAPFGIYIGTFITGETQTALRLEFQLIDEGVFEFSSIIVYPLNAALGYDDRFTPVAYNSGGEFVDVTPYQDITEYVLSIRTRSGKNTFDAPIAFDGTADIVLNNDTRIFSQANVNSPLHGRLIENLKTIIQYKYAGEWHNLWSGWTHEWTNDPGAASSRQATLRCRQGLYRFREGEFRPEVIENITPTDLAAYYIAKSSWYSPAAGQQTFLDFSTVGVDTVLQPPDALFSAKDAGIFPLELTGDEWGRSTNLESVLRTLLGAENSQLWVDRAGFLVIRNRDYFVGRVPDFILNLGMSAVQASFRYGHDIINRIEVQLKPKRTITGAVVWESKQPFELGAKHRREPAVKVFEIDTKFTEKSPRTVTKIYSIAEGSSIQAWKRRMPGSRKASIAFSAEEIERYFRIDLVDVAGGKAIRFSSTYPNTAYLSATILGDYIEGGETEVYVIEDVESITKNRAVYTEKADIPVFQNEQEALEFAQYRLFRKAVPRPEFNEFTLVSNKILDQIHNIQIGTIVGVSEPEQLVSDVITSVVLGEDFDIRANEIRVKYSLAALDTNTYAQVNGLAQTGHLIFV